MLAVIILFVSFVGFIFLSIQTVSAAPGIRQTINFQGKLVDDDGLNVADSTYSVVFTLYDAASGGTQLWQETRSVATSDGIFREELGTSTSLSSVDFNSDSIYLGIKVGADAEMTPRVRFTATPYAFQAQNVPWSGLKDAAANLAVSMGSYTSTFTYGSSTGANDLFKLTDTASNTGTGRILSVQSASGSTVKPFHVSAGGAEAILVDANGNVGIGTTNPTRKLDVNGTLRLRGQMYDYNNEVGTPGQVLSTTANGVDWIDAGSVGTDNQTLANVYSQAGNNVQLTGAYGDIRFYRGTTTEMLFLDESSGNVGIGTTNPTYKLSVNGSVEIVSGSELYSFGSATLGNRSYTTPTYVVSGQTFTASIQALDDAVEGVISGSGGVWTRDIGSGYLFPQTLTDSVGIGTSTPTAKLQVVGNIVGSTLSDGTISITSGTIAGVTSIAVADGLQATPSYTFTNDSNTGFYRPASDSIGIGTSGVERIRVAPNGNVGIGTTNPGYKLDVSGDIRIANGSELYSFGSATLGNRTYTEDNYVTDGQTFTASIDALDQQLADVIGGSGGVWSRDIGNGYLFPQTLTDSVGIGTTAPSEKLHVVGNAIITGNITSGGIITGTGSGLTGLNASNLASGTVPSVRVSGNYSGITGVGTITSGTWQGSVISSTYLDPAVILATEIDTSAELAGIIGDETGSGALVFANSPTFAGNVLFPGSGIWESTGDVGIGTTNPGYKLDVNGDVRIASGSELYSFGSATLGNRTYTEDNYVADGQTFTASIDALDQQLADVIGGSGGVWSRNAGSGYLYPQTLTDSVGIGTSVPSEKLHVIGNAIISGNITSGGIITGTGSGLTGLNASNLASGTVPSARVSGNYSGITGVGTITSGTWQGSVISSTYLDPAVILSTEIDTYTELNTIVADVTLTHNGLIDTSAEIAGIVGDETGSGSLVFSNSPSLTTPNIGAATGTSLNVTGAITAGGIITGTGSGLTALNASNLTTGTVPNGRLVGAYSNFSNVTGSGNSQFANFRAGDGTRSAPSYSFTSDTNTGMYRIGTDILSFATAGADQLTVLAGGNVGIGTTNPTYKLSVNGSLEIVNGSELYSFGSATLGNRSYTTPTYVASGQTFTASIQALDDAVEGVISGSGGVWSRNAGSGYLFPQTLTDSVGIGTSAPSEKLHVIGNAIISGNITSGGIITGTGSGLTGLNASNLASGTVPSARVSGNYSGITGVGTITSGTWQGSVISSTYLDPAVILSTEIDTYTELNTIVADVTLTHNGLIDTYTELNTIVSDVTLTHNGLIDTSAEIAGIVGDETGTGSLVFSNSPALVTPNIGAATGTSLNVTGAITAGGIITGTGSGLTGLNASNLASGTVPSARVSGNYSGITGVGTITSGTWQGSVISSTYLDPAVILSTEIDTSSEIATIVGDETGSGALVFANAPTFAGNVRFPGSGIWESTGDVGIGTTDPGAKLEVAGQVKITGGSPGANKVLTSDANGLATWETLGAASIGDDSLDFDKFADNMTLDAKTTINQAGFDFGFQGTGNVGIGTSVPSEKLHVVGNAIISGNITSGGIITGTGSGLTGLNASNLASGTVPSARISGNYSGITGVGTITSGTWQGSVISSTYLDPAVILSTEIDTYTELNTIVSDVTLTHNGLIDTSAEIAGIVGDETGTGSLVFSNSPALVTPNIGAATGTSLNVTGAITAGGIITGTGSGLSHLNASNLTTGTVPNGRIAGAYTNFSNVTGSGTAQFGIFSASNGSRTAPSYTFTSDTNTGMYRIGTDILSLTTAGSDRFTILADGSVGIGTTNPQEALQVEGNIRLEADGNNEGLYGISSSGNTIFSLTRQIAPVAGSVAMQAYGGLGFAAGATGGPTVDYDMIIESGGDVGIGTTNPGAKLEVAGQVKITGGSPGVNKVLTSDANGLAAWETLTSASIDDDSLDFDKFKDVMALDADTHVNQNTYDFSFFNTGNVGIGTSTPTAKLHVEGTSLITGNVDVQSGLDVTGASLTVGGSYSWTTGGVITAATDETINGIDISAGAISDVADITLNSAGQIDFADVAEDKAYWYSNTYGTGVEGSTLTNWSASQFRWRVGGTSATTGTEELFMNGTTLRPGTNGGLDLGSSTVRYGTAYVNDLCFDGGTDCITGAPVDGTGTANRVAYWTDTDTIAADNDFFFDGTNVGIGTTSPNAMLDVNGAGRIGYDSNTTSYIGRAAVGYGGGYNDSAYFGHLDLAGSAGNYSLIQTSAGATLLNAPTGSFIDFRINNTSVGQIEGDGDLAYDTSTLFVDAAGNQVGIGTNDPAYKLQVQGTGQGLTFMADAINQADSSNIRFMENSTSGFRMQYDGLIDGLRFKDQQTDLDIAYFGRNGEVGIGTTNPTEKLHIYNSANSFVLVEAGAGSWPAYKLQIAGSETGAIFTDPTTNSLNIQNTADDDIFFKTANNEHRMTILSDTGNVGIGTTNPGAALEVAGQVKITGGTPGANKVLVSDAVGLASWTTLGEASIDDDSLDFDKFIDNMTLDNTTTIDLAGYNLGIHGTGNVGIGTSNPSQKLEVAGSALVTTNIYVGTTDVQLSRGAANRLDLASGDSFNLASGNLQVGGTTVVTSGRIVQTANGTRTAPAYSFSADTNTGMYRITNDVLSLTTAGSDRLTIDIAGNVGIGTTNPNALLDVNGGARIGYDTDTTSYIGRAAVGYGGAGYSDYAYFGHLDISGSGGNYALLQRYTGQTFLNAASGQSINFRINNADMGELQSDGDWVFDTSTLFVDASANHVGVGTLTPQGPLSVVLPDWTNRDTDSQHVILGNSGDDDQGIRLGFSNTKNFGVINVLNPTVAWGDLILQDNGGNVGIGTTDPDAKLHVVGDQWFDGWTYMNSAGNNLVFNTDASTRTIWEVQRGSLGTRPSQLWNVQASSTDDLVFGGTTAGDFVVDSANVGIGTATPSDPLHVVSATDDRVTFDMSEGTIQLSSYPAGALPYSGAAGLYVTDSSVNIMTGLNNTGQINFNTITGGSWQRRMTILNSGLVGIGTDAPSSALDVIGSIELSGSITDSTDNYVNINDYLSVELGTYDLSIEPRNTWGNGATNYPTIRGSHSNEWVMLHGPHIPYLQNGAGSYSGTTAGAIVRLAADSGASTYWDVGIDSDLGGDTFGISRGTSNFFRIANNGTVTIPGLVQSDNLGVIYHNDNLENGSQVAQDVRFTFPTAGATTTGSFGTYLLTWSNRAQTASYILNVKKQYNGTFTVTMSKVGGSGDAGYDTIANTTTDLELLFKQNISSATHQTSSASFTVTVLEEVSSGRRPTIAAEDRPGVGWTSPALPNNYLGAGNVGIGTAGPSEALDVIGNIELSGVIQDSTDGILNVSDALTTTGSILNSAANGELGASANFVFRDTGDSWLRLRTASGGSTYADLAINNLHTNGNIQNVGTLSFSSSANHRISSNASGLLFDGGDGSNWDFLVYDDNVYSDNLILGYSGSAQITTYDTNENLIIDPNGTGLVGIGTGFTPTSDLHIGGSSTTSDGTPNIPGVQIAGGTGGWGKLELAGGAANTAGHIDFIRYEELGGDFTSRIIQRSGSLNFATTAETNFSIRNSNGFVGIGHTNPSSALDVVGDFEISGVMSDSTDGYVNFNDSIQTSGHLYVSANGYLEDDTTNGGNTDDWIKFSGYIEMRSNTDNYGIVLRDSDSTSYFAMTQVGGTSYLTDSNTSGNYFLAGNGANATVRGNLCVGGGTSYCFTSAGSISTTTLAADTQLYVGGTADRGFYYAHGDNDLYVGGLNAQDGNIIVKDRNNVERIRFDTDTSYGHLKMIIPTSGNTGLCHVTDGSFERVVDCSSAPTDLAENFSAIDTTIEPGDLVVTDGQAEVVPEPNTPGKITSKAAVKKTSGQYDDNLIGIISTDPNQLYGDDGLFDQSENPVPVSLAGRVPTKVSLENGPIKTGDYITSSSTPGVGMKATRAGRVVGIALQDFYGGSGNNQFGKIVVFVNPTWYDPSSKLNSAGELSITADNGLYSVINNTDNKTFDNSYAAKEMIAAYLRTGKISTTDLKVSGKSEFTSLEVSNFKLGGKTLNEYIEDSVVTGQIFTSLDDQLTAQETQIAQLDLESNILSTSVASQSASLSTVTARLDQIEQATNDTEAVITSLQDRIAALETMFENNMSTNSAMLFTESPSATVSGSIARSISDTEVIFDKKLIAEDDLTVLGKLNTSDIGVTGTISSGLLTINGFNDEMATPSATISTLGGILSLQHDGLSGIEMVAGKVAIDVDGNVLVREGDVEIENGDLVLRKGSIKGSTSIRGIDVPVTAGATEVTVTFTDVNDTDTYAISVLPTWFTNIIVQDKTIDGFKILFDRPAPADATLDWLIVE